MNKVLQLTTTSLLAGGITFSLPLPAEPIAPSFIRVGDDMAPAPWWEELDENADSTSTAPQPAEPLRFTLQHRFNGGTPVAKETVEIPIQLLEDNPFVLLQKLKENFVKHLAQQPKPVTIDTELDWLLPAEVTDVLGQLPKVSIKTNVESNGAGNSKLVFPPYQRQVPETEGGGLIDWKGLTGHFAFQDQFNNLTAALNIAGLSIEGPDNFTASLGKSTYSGAFDDANLEPTQMIVNLPTFNMREADTQFNVQALFLGFNGLKTHQGIDIGKWQFNVGQIGFSEGGEKFSLEGLAITSAGAEMASDKPDPAASDETTVSEGQDKAVSEATTSEAQDPAASDETTVSDGQDPAATSEATTSDEPHKLINYTIQTKIGKLALPKELTMGEPLEIGFVGNLDLRRLNADALLALQTMLKQMEGQPETSMMGMMLLSQALELLPKFLANSPEIGLTPLSVTTPKGNFVGNLNVRLDGTKATALDTAVLLSALQAQAEVTVGKNLLKQVIVSQTYDSLLEIAQLSGEELSPADLAQLQKQAATNADSQIQMLVIMQLLTEADANNYKLVADFKDGKLTLNGQEMPLPFGAPQVW